MDRRSVLAAVGAAGVGGLAGLAGCSSRNSPSTADGDGETVEVLVDNGADETKRIAVRIDDRDGNHLFSHVYELAPGHTDQTAGDGEVDATPGTVTAFLPGGPAETWEYSTPDDLGCDAADVGVSVESGGTIEFYATC